MGLGDGTPNGEKVGVTEQGKEVQGMLGAGPGLGD